ncbi:fatty acyl-AMP ligase [Streptomyces sp. NPDC049687]|uniref:fatty acyl-AMP ligase n=1 Tax=Streptomyces sp. NPDC049687 TaxID=3365596 RepID=UPI0037B9A04D
MADYRSFAELMWERVDLLGDRTAYLNLPVDGGTADPEPVTYRMLDRAARSVAATLQGLPGRPARVLVAQSRARHVAESLLACWYAGAVAIPVPPGGGRHHAERLRKILKDARVEAVLSDRSGASELSRHLAWAGQERVPCLAVDGAAPADPDDWRRPAPAAEAALIEYTSGTSGEPKGVLVSHRNLLANQRAIREAFGTHEGTVVGGWLPLHHDMGLIGQLLHPLWLGARGVVMAPWVFAQEPLRWLRMIGEHGVTATAAPGFAYESCVRRVPPERIGELDLSGLETAVVGAEPVRAGTLRAFTERFAPAGLRRGTLRPAYGLAEATLLVTAAGRAPEVRERVVDAAAIEEGRLEPADHGGRQRTLVSCGRPVGAELRIVDPESRAVLPEGRIGEIWVRGDGVATGYWGRPLDTRGAFDARTADGGTGFLRTGDLGLLDGGELFVTGRLKDVMFLEGRHLHPHDLEQSAQSASPLCGAATVFSVAADHEHIVVIQEVALGHGADQDLGRLGEALRDRLAGDFSVTSSSIVLVRAGTIRRTTSGKVRRSRMRQLFLNGALDPLHTDLAPEVRELLCVSRP